MDDYKELFEKTDSILQELFDALNQQNAEPRMLIRLTPKTCSCREKHRGEHPRCPRCNSDETKRTRNYGRPVGNQWWCLRCGRRWEPTG